MNQVESELSMFILVALVFAVGTSASDSQPSTRTDCRDVTDCREQALQAASRQDYELFHDLAWRALQKAPKNDGELMTLVARAQSLSGRPHDALVMLSRLAAMNVTTDAATSDDFRRVRELPGWPELEARIAAIGTSDATANATAARASVTPPNPAKPVDARPGRDETVVGEPSEALRFTTVPFTPAGLAYDAVSNRFIVGDRDSKKLSVVGERSHNVSNLVSADTAGFGEIAALAIDPREGDLWVVSTEDGGSSVHKLQLISGRLFFSLESAKDSRVRFADLVVTPHSTVIALDDLGGRLFRVRPKSRELHVGWVLEAPGPVSVAAPSDTVAYVAYRDGITRVDLASGSERPIRARNGIELTGLTWIRPHHNGLVAIQRTAEGVFRVIRIRLDASGTRATAVVVLDRDVVMAAPAAAALVGDSLYYLSAPSPGGAASPEKIVKSVKLR